MEGKSDRYKDVSAECSVAIRAAKKSFVGKVIDSCKKAKNNKRFYKSVKMLQTKEAPKAWSIYSLFPGLSSQQIAEIVATFFNQISHEYPPLPDPDKGINADTEDVIQVHEVAARLRTFRKPKSMVYGDINPELITQFSDLLAPPVCFIYNQALKSLHWPSIWKAETVTIIPKNSAPSSLSEL